MTTDQITWTDSAPGLREGDVVRMSGIPLRGWRRFVAWLLRRPLTRTETFVVRGLQSDTSAEVVRT